jgi:hypothetical protein
MKKRNEIVYVIPERNLIFYILFSDRYDNYIHFEHDDLLPDNNDQ